MAAGTRSVPGHTSIRRLCDGPAGAPQAREVGWGGLHSEVAGRGALRLRVCDAGSHCRRHVRWRAGGRSSAWGPRDSAPVPPSRSEARPRPPDGPFRSALPASSAAPADRLRALGLPPTIRAEGQPSRACATRPSSPAAGPAPPPSSGLSVPPGEGAVEQRVAPRAPRSALAVPARPSAGSVTSVVASCSAYRLACAPLAAPVGGGRHRTLHRPDPTFPRLVEERFVGLDRDRSEPVHPAEVVHTVHPAILPGSASGRNATLPG